MSAHNPSISTSTPSVNEPLRSASSISTQELLRAGLQDIDEARTLLNQVQETSVFDPRMVLSALKHAADPDVALRHLLNILYAQPAHTWLGADSTESITHTVDDVSKGSNAAANNNASNSNATHGATSVSVSDAQLHREVITPKQHDKLTRLISILGVSSAIGDFMRLRPPLINAVFTPSTRTLNTTREEHVQAMLEAVQADTLSLEEATTRLRAHYRERLAAIIAADVTASDIEAVEPHISRQLSYMADAALTGALAIARKHVPQAQYCRFAVIAMGKLGAQELNYVSDVDLMYVVEPTDNAPFSTQELLRVGARIATMLQRVCSSTMMHVAEAPLWQIDTALRPEGKDGELVKRLSAYRNYYEHWAQNWEFQALLKARGAAGDAALIEQTIAMMQPFIWTAASRDNFVNDCQHMRQRVENLIPQALKNRDIKLGRGGLRDVEFTIQMLQLVHGRSDTTLRLQGTLQALQALSEGGYISRTQAKELSANYRFERVLEHRQQLWKLKRTHLFPELPAEQQSMGATMATQVSSELKRLARATRLSVTELIARYQAARQHIRRLHLDIYYRPMLPINAQLNTEQITLTPQATKERFESIGFADPQAAMRHIEALTAGVSRAAKINRIIMPSVLQWLGEGQNPDMGLLNWQQLEQRFGSGSPYLGILRDSRAAAQRLCTALANSQYLAQALNRSVESITWLDDDTQLQPRTRESLDKQALAALERHAGSLNDMAFALRSMRRREIERIGLGWMSHLISDECALAAMTDVYDAFLNAALAWAMRKHQAYGVLDVSIIALGRYGGGEVNFSSDADIMALYSPHETAKNQAHTVLQVSNSASHQASYQILQQASLQTPYQALHQVPEVDLQQLATRIIEDVRALAQTPAISEPKLEIDMDLRPEGKHGALMRSYDAMRQYYTSWASTWEHQALLRARHAAGDQTLGELFLREVADPLRYPQTLSATQISEIRRLKARMEAERLPRGVPRERHLKLGRGGLSDVEWTVQLLQLRYAHDVPALRTRSTLQALDELAAQRIIAEQDAAILRRAWVMCTTARNGNYLWSGRIANADILPSDVYSLGGVGVYAGYGAHQGGRFENDILSLMRQCRKVMQRLFYEQHAEP